MKHRLAIALVGLAVVLGFLVSQKDTVKEEARPVVALRPSLPERSQTSRQLDPARKVSRTPELTEGEREDAMQQIGDAVITYEAAAVKVIAPFLTSPDRELRSAAREGLIQLGEPDGIAALRLAATLMSDSAETNACREAADFLELPSWSETPEAREIASRLVANPEPPPPPP
ncbi:MAG: hypothetical protein QM755_15650 [Luteolibacter sp.]